MKAVVHARYGNPDVLQVTSLRRPVPKSNEVLIRVHAAGLDYGQWHLMTGTPYVARLATGLTKPRQPVLGMDLSGVVEAVGAGVTRFKIGDAVFGAASRTFAEFTCAREDQVCLKPERLSFEQAAASARPASFDARRRRAPKLSSQRPASCSLGRTEIGCRTPRSRIVSASSCRPLASNS